MTPTPTAEWAGESLAHGRGTLPRTAPRVGAGGGGQPEERLVAPFPPPGDARVSERDVPVGLAWIVTRDASEAVLGTHGYSAGHQTSLPRGAGRGGAAFGWGQDTQRPAVIPIARAMRHTPRHDWALQRARMLRGARARMMRCARMLGGQQAGAVPPAGRGVPVGVCAGRTIREAGRRSELDSSPTMPAGGATARTARAARAAGRRHSYLCGSSAP